MSLKVGIIGLGIMGGAFAKNLLNADFEVYGFDIADTNIRALVELGGKEGSSPKNIANQTDVIITSLPSITSFHEVMTGEDGLTEANTDSLGRISLIATKQAATAIFSTTASVFDKGIDVSAMGGIAFSESITTKQSPVSLNAGTGSLTVRLGKTLDTTGQVLGVIADDVNIAGTLSTGTATRVVKERAATRRQSRWIMTPGPCRPVHKGRRKSHSCPGPWRADPPRYRSARSRRPQTWCRVPGAFAEC